MSIQPAVGAFIDAMSASMNEMVRAVAVPAGEGVRDPQRGASLTGSRPAPTVTDEPYAEIGEILSGGCGVHRSAAEASPIERFEWSSDRALGVDDGDIQRCQIEESPRSEQAVSQVLDTFIANMRLEKPRVLGFPGNLDFQYSHLAGLLDIFVNNVGDPGSIDKAEVGSKLLERAVIEFLAELSNARPASTYGYVTSGGSEANLFGLDRGCTVLPDARIYASAEVHYSIRKSARLLRKELVTVACDDGGCLDPSALGRLCRGDAGRGAVVVASIGTTMTGAIDDVAAIAEAAAAAGDVYIHLDAALGGLLIPFTAEGPSWGFASPAVGSLAVSMHKVLGMPVPCAVALCRSDLVDSFVQAPEFVGPADSTLGCSRSGLAIMLLWYGLVSNGRAGLAARARTALNTAEFAAKKLADVGANPMLLPLSIVVVFDRPTEWVCHKYHLATEGDRAHIVTVGHVTREVIDELCVDIRESR